MIPFFRGVGDFFKILHEQTPWGDRAWIGTGYATSGTLAFSDWAGIVGILVGIVTVAATVQRMFIAHEEYRYRKQQREAEAEAEVDSLPGSEG